MNNRIGDKIGMTWASVRWQECIQHDTESNEDEWKKLIYTVGYYRFMNTDKPQSQPVLIAVVSLVFHCSATSLANGSSGLGALSKACIESKTVLICRAGLHLSAKRAAVLQTPTASKMYYPVDMHV